MNDTDRQLRAPQPPLVALPHGEPGIRAAMALSPALGASLRSIAQTLLVEPFAKSTLSRHERELLATAASSTNDCVFCTDSHAAFARELGSEDESAHVDDVVSGRPVEDKKLHALVQIVQTVAKRALDLNQDQIAAAIEAGANEDDVRLSILIASAFCMYNRMVDGLRAPTPADPNAYTDRAANIAGNGYL